MPPQQSISIHGTRGQLPGKEVLPSGVPRKFLTFSFFLFLSMLLIYFGLSVGYQTFLNSEIAGLEEDIETLRFQNSVEQQENLVRFFSQINNVQEILGDHVVISNMFPILEANTHSRVVYTRMEVSVVERKIVIEGIAESFDALVAQLTIYEDVPEIQRAVLESADRRAGVVEFKVSLVVVPELFGFTGS